MKAKSVAVAALLVAALVVMLVQRSQIGRLEAARRALPAPEATAAPAAAARSPSMENDLRREIASLRRQLGEALRAAAAPATSAAPAAAGPAAPPPAPAAVPTNPAPDGLAQLITNAVALSFEAQMARARTRLGLTDLQEQQVRDIVTAAFEEGGRNLQRVLSGEAQPADVPTQEEWAKAMEDRILAALSPEQQAAYRKYKREDATAAARLSAQGELMAVQGALGLSQEQQDQMFAVIYYQTLSRLDPEPDATAGRPRDPVEATRWDQARRLALLETVLKPDQLQTYGQLQETYARYLEGLLKRKSP